MTTNQQQNNNFLQVGEMTACGHCQPDKFATAESQGGICECKCHTPQNTEGWEKELKPRVTSVIPEMNQEQIAIAQWVLDKYWESLRPAIKSLLLTARREDREKLETISLIIKDIKSYSPDGEIGTLCEQALSILSPNTPQE